MNGLRNGSMKDKWKSIVKYCMWGLLLCLICGVIRYAWLCLMGPGPSVWPTVLYNSGWMTVFIWALIVMVVLLI